MKRLSLNQASKQWDKSFNFASKEVFKCEVLQDYTAIDAGPSLDAWLRGDKMQSLQNLEPIFNNAWWKLYNSKKIKKTRVHIVEEPYTEYLKWEIEFYKLSKKLGSTEKIYLVNKNKLRGLDLPSGDFWIFDSEQVLEYQYAGNKGQSTGATLYNKSESARFIALKDQLLKYKQPV